MKKKKTTQKLQKDKKIQKEDKSYREHTISSAIKSDYAKPDVKAKLSELNSSVDSRVESLSNSKLESVDNTKSKSPFLVGRVRIKIEKILRQFSYIAFKNKFCRFHRN